MRCLVCSAVQPPASSPGHGGQYARNRRRAHNRERCVNCGSHDLVASSSESPPSMLRLGVAEFEAAMDATDWDPEDFDGLDPAAGSRRRIHEFDVDIERLSTGDLNPDPVPFDFNRPDRLRDGQTRGDQARGSSGDRTPPIVDELSDPLRFEQPSVPILKALFNIDSPDLTSGEYAVRVGLFGLCLAAMVLLNAVLLLVLVVAG